MRNLLGILAISLLSGLSEPRLQLAQAKETAEPSCLVETFADFLKPGATEAALKRRRFHDSVKKMKEKILYGAQKPVRSPSGDWLPTADIVGGHSSRILLFPDHLEIKKILRVNVDPTGREKITLRILCREREADGRVRHRTVEKLVDLKLSEDFGLRQGFIRDGDGAYRVDAEYFAAHPELRLEDELPVLHANGTIGLTFNKLLTAGTRSGSWSKGRASTLVPVDWSDEKFIAATHQTFKSRNKVKTDSNGYTLYRSTVDGVVIEVITNPSGELVSAYPEVGMIPRLNHRFII